MKDIKRWRGLGKLIGDAVEQGASAVERVHLEMAKRPFELLKHLPGISDPVEGIKTVHDAVVSSTYGSVRVVTRVVSKGVDLALQSLDEEEPADDAKPNEE